MITLFKRLLIPSRFDAFCLAIATHWLMALVYLFAIGILYSWQGEYLLQPINLVVAATWIGVAASCCWRSHSLSRCCLLLCSATASLGLVHTWYWLNPQVTDKFGTFDRWGSGTGWMDAQRSLVLECWYILAYVLAAIGVLLLNLLLCFLWRKMSSASDQGSTSKKNGSARTRLLVWFAGILFAILITMRIAEGLGIEVAGDPLRNVEWGLTVVSVLFLWSVFLLWFPRSFSTCGRWIQKTVSLLLLIAVLTLLAVRLEEFEFISVLILAAVSFVSSVIGVGGYSAKTSDSGEARTKPRFLPSLASLLIVLGFSAVFATLSLVDMKAISATFESLANVGQADAKRAAGFVFSSANAKLRSGGRVSFEYDSEYQSPVWRFKCDESASANQFSLLPNERIEIIEIVGLDPRFEITSFDGGYIILRDCKVSHSQLDALLASGTGFLIQGSFEIVDDGTSVNPGFISTTVFKETAPGTAAAFFDATKCESQINYATFDTPVSQEDWTKIENCPQTSTVFVNQGWTADFQFPESCQLLASVIAFDTNGTGFGSKRLQQDLVLNTNIRFEIKDFDSSETPQLAWNLFMLRGTHLWLGDMNDWEQNFAEFAKRIGMAYQVRDGEIESLYLPTGESIANQKAAISELRVLSFDRTWIDPTVASIPSGFVRFENVDYLESLTSLEELYFDPLVAPEDLAFLAELKKLKHLQISARQSASNSANFDSCQSLESVTMTGVPDFATIQELSRLSKLARFVLVDVESDPSLNPRYIAGLKQQLPGVDISILKAGNMELLVPQPFRDYRDRLREELRDDPAWIGQIFQEPLE